MDCFAEPVVGRRFAPTRWLAITAFRGAARCATLSVVVVRLDRATQYSEALVMESRSCGVLDPPLLRGMTAFYAAAPCITFQFAVARESGLPEN
jgi:hypothetical protein